MADEDLQALRRAARAGDPAARPPLVRALLRAGRPVSEAWDDDALRAGPGLAAAVEALTPPAREALTRDLASLDPSRLVAHLRDDAGARRVLARYPAGDGERWLRVHRGRPGGPWTLDLERPPEPLGPGADALLRRDRWDARTTAVPISAPFGVPLPRLRELAGRLLDRLGAPFQPRTLHRGVPNDHAPYALETLHVDGARRLCVSEAWGAPSLHAARSRAFGAELEGLPGDPAPTLSFPVEHEWCLRRPELVGAPADLPAIEAAWLEVLVEVARRAARFDDHDPESRLLPEAWRARARRAASAQAKGWTVHDPITDSLWSIVPVDGAPFAVALRGDLPQSPDDAAGVRLRPIGPAPAAATRVDLRATREQAAPDLLERLFLAVTGRCLPDDAEVSRERSVPASPGGRGDTSLFLGEEQRFRYERWLALRVRAPVDGERLRVLHDDGLLIAQARTTGEGRALTLCLFVPVADADARRAAVVAALERGGWRL